MVVYSVIKVSTAVKWQSAERVRPAANHTQL